VSVGRIDGLPTARPQSWTESEEGAFCLSCSRAIAADAALDSVPADKSPQDRARIRRTALIEFELRRTPHAPDRSIANACHTSAPAVAAVRLAIAAPAAAPRSDLRAGK
jgi:hypothetical protein